MTADEIIMDDDTYDQMDKTDTTDNQVQINVHANKNKINFLSTNARSLYPKFGSLKVYMEELDVSFSVVTESWLVDGEKLDNDLIDLEAGSDIKILYKNRPAKITKRYKRRTAGGGVTILFNKKKCDFKEFKLPANKHEIIAGVCNLPKMKRKMVVFGVYIPPQTKADESHTILAFLNDAIMKAKEEIADCFLQETSMVVI